MKGSWQSDSCLKKNLMRYYFFYHTPMRLSEDKVNIKNCRYFFTIFVHIFTAPLIFTVLWPEHPSFRLIAWVNCLRRRTRLENESTELEDLKECSTIPWNRWYTVIFIENWGKIILWIHTTLVGLIWGKEGKLAL